MQHYSGTVVATKEKSPSKFASGLSQAAAQAADALAVGMSWELGSASTMHYLSAQAVSTGREHYLSAPERYRLACDHR